MIDLINISLQFSGKYLFKNINLKINSEDKISLVGANGAGKSSLLNIISNKLEPETGLVQKQKNISLGYLPQEQVVHSGKSLIDEAGSAMVNLQTLQKNERELTKQLSAKNLNENEREDILNRLGEIHHHLEALDSYSATSKVEKVLTGLGFTEEDFKKNTGEFSGGWQMRIALSKILIAQNDILLLDEPTNHLDLDSLEWLIEFLHGFKGALVIVSHDRHFINSVTDKTFEIFSEKVNFFNGNFDSYLNFKEGRDNQLAHKKLLQQKKIKETQRFIERFRYKATKAKQVQSRIKQLDKLEIIDLPDAEKNIDIRFPDPPASGVYNVELTSICKSYGSNVVLRDIDLRINRGDKIAFVGINGAGKTTLAKIIAGEIEFNSGDRMPGHNTIVAYYSQDTADSLDPDKDVLETLEAADPTSTISQLRSLLGAFLFTGEDVFKKVQVLSGGEKSRLALAKILLTKSNFIILDEPTNHLDYSSKAVLQNALINFPGSLILVSHDIEFLKPIVNRVVEVRNNSIKLFEGGIEYYLSKRIEYQAEVIKSTGSNDVPSRKNIKRIEAERRQQKYNATKEILKQITELEIEIEKDEKDFRDTELKLGNAETYKDSEVARKVTSDFSKLKIKLEEKLKLWEELSKKLNRIEKDFS